MNYGMEGGSVLHLLIHLHHLNSMLGDLPHGAEPLKTLENGWEIRKGAGAPYVVSFNPQTFLIDAIPRAFDHNGGHNGDLQRVWCLLTPRSVPSVPLCLPLCLCASSVPPLCLPCAFFLSIDNCWLCAFSVPPSVPLCLSLCLWGQLCASSVPLGFSLCLLCASSVPPL